MAYAPRQRKYKVRWKIAVPLILLVALVLYAVAGLLFPQKKEEAKKFTVCGLNSEETIHLLNKRLPIPSRFGIMSFTENLWVYILRHMMQKATRMSLQEKP